MRLAEGARGISTLVTLLLLLVSFVLGATLSYIFTIGFYAPSEFNIPSEPILAIEDVPKFFPENATFFNVTVLNPSYSPSNVTVERIEVETRDGEMHSTFVPAIRDTIPVGGSRIFKASWNWGNYTGQPVRVHVMPVEGLGSSIRTTTPAMNFTITDIDINPSLSAERFNITVRNVGSSALVNITKVLVNNEQAATEPLLTTLSGLTNASDSLPVELTIKRNWVDLQGKNVTIAVQTLQGYTFYKTTVPPGPVTLSIDRRLVVFNATYTNHFNMTVINEKSISGYVNITEVNVDVYVNGQLNRTVTLNSSAWVADPSAVINLSTSLGITRLTCYWDWSGYLGEAATVTIRVRTLQGFQTPPLSDVAIP